MPGRTVARQTPDTQTAKSRGHSPQRILCDRLTLGKFKPRAWAVAQVLEGYAHLDTDKRRFATVYHSIIADRTGLSVANVRRALRELTSGEAPLYEKRGSTGHQRKVRGRNGWELDTRGVVYYWIENLEAYLAARDTARAGNVLAFEERKQEQHAERVKLQAAMFAGQIDQATYDAKVAQLDAKARGRLPKTATTRKPSRCLTAKQLERFADLLVRGGATSHSTLLDAGGEKGVREFHALHRHIFGNGDAGVGCQTCEESLFVIVRQARAVASTLQVHRAEAVRCGCGVLVVRSASAGAVLFWGWAGSETPESHADCIHEQNRLLKLRNGDHQ